MKIFSPQRTQSLQRTLNSVNSAFSVVKNFLNILIFFSACFYSPIFGVVRDYHGTQVDDPFAWLEDMESSETQKWVNEQNHESCIYFQKIAFRDHIKNKLTHYSEYETCSVPIQINDRLFFSMRDLGEEKKKLCVLEPSGEEKVLVNPNKYQNIILTDFEVSPDSQLLAYGLSDSGSDSENWFFLDVDTGKHIPGQLKGIRFSKPVWSQENQGIYYVHFEKHALYYHDLKEKNQENDQLIFDASNHLDWLISDIQLIFDEKFLIFSVRTPTDLNNGVYLIDLNDHSLREILSPGKAKLQFVGEHQKQLFFITDDEASHNKLIALNSLSPNFKKSKTIIRESQFPLVDAYISSDRIICNYLEDCVSQVKVFDLNGHFIKNISLPGKGTVSIPNKENTSNQDVYFAYTDFITPSTIFRHLMSENRTVEFFKPSLNPQFSYITKQVFITSKDGTSIPMFITHKAGLCPNGDTPTLMYGYGGFNLPLSPMFSPLTITWLDLGGIYVSVNLRGGSEYGKEWYENGKGSKKQNVFDDFISAGQWLISNHYTNSRKLAINGRSNGGLLVGACLTQRPDLFGAAVPQVGVLDMLRFHQFTIGSFWKCDYGDPEDPSDFLYLYAYSPYHQIKEGMHFPATLITTADHDDRVVPMHSYKFAAKLKQSQCGDSPILLKVYPNAGHQTGSSLSLNIEENSDILSFLIRELGFETSFLIGS